MEFDLFDPFTFVNTPVVRMGRTRSCRGNLLNPRQSGVTQEKIASPSTQPPKRQKTLSPKGDKGKGKAVGGSKEALAPSPDESEYEITRRNTGVVFGSDTVFSHLSPKELRVRWRRAMGQLVGNKDLAQLASIPAKTRVNELLALQAEVLTLRVFCMISNIRYRIINVRFLSNFELCFADEHSYAV